MNKFDTKILTTDAQRKALLHPVRHEIIGLLSENPMTITQVAKEFGVHPANISHHFKKLESAKIIEVVEERDIGRVVERYFSPTAVHFEIEQKTSNANKKVLNFLKSDLEMNIKKLENDDSENVIGLIKRANINQKVFDQFSRKLFKLIEEFEATNNSGSECYGLNLSLYPHKVDYGALKQIKIEKREV